MKVQRLEGEYFIYNNPSTKSLQYYILEYILLMT